jgi:hypothetical protein
MEQQNVEQRLAECERVLRKLEGADDRQERVRLLREMRLLIKSIEVNRKIQS